MNQDTIYYLTKIIDLWMPLKIKYEHIPGVSIGVVYKRKLVYAKGFGFADEEKKIKATEKTLYHIASISKVFTSLAILKLAGEKKLKLNDPVAKHIEWFKGKNKIGDLSRVTLRQILCHSSGLFRDGNKPYWEGSFPESLEDTISSHSIILKNLSQFKYSNHAFSLLGNVIEKVSGVSYKKYVQDNILSLLRMKNTHVYFNEELTNQLAKGYGRIVPKIRREIFGGMNTNAYSPATGFISNVVDLGKFLIGQYFSKEMIKPHINIDGKGRKYGLGIEIFEIAKRKIIGHGGGFPGYITDVAIDLKEELGVVVLTNCIGSPVSQIKNGIFEAFYFLSENKLGEFEPEMESYDGIYRNKWGDDAVVAIGKNLVVFNIQQGPFIKNMSILNPKENNRFIINNKNNFDSVGEVAGFEGFKNGIPQKINWAGSISKRLRAE
jgi:CubicO group peptidase (beta-lactamase class C family)